MKNILIGISWPFANGDLHLGHIASSLSGDIIARYYRLKGENVVLVSGTDCHGTPIEVEALKKKCSQKELADKCHENFKRDFKDIGISFDEYFRTDDEYHKKFVKEKFQKYYENGYLYPKEESQLYCKNCELFLADRYITGVCPKCGNLIKGDECEKCGSLFQIGEVKEKRCSICGKEANYKKTKNLYFSLSKFQSELECFVNEKSQKWRDNAVLFTRRYLDEKVPDRCASRHLNWGISIPIKGYEDKKIYGWFENVWGYVSASKKYLEEKGLNYEDYWKQGKDNEIYLIHAKDNIPFHTIIFPSLLLACEDNYKLPDRIISDEYLTIEGEKLSKSKGNYITIRELLDKYPADAIRYYLSINDPDKRDFNFTYNGFINSINSELLGKWGNFVNRTLAFINKSFDGELTKCSIDEEISSELKKLYDNVGEDIVNGNTKQGLEKIFDFVSKANKYFDVKQPWILAKTDKEECKKILFNCVNIIFNINTLLKPYLFVSTEKVEEYLNTKHTEWKYNEIGDISLSKEVKPLYVRYDAEVIEKELEELKIRKDINVIE